MSFYIQKIILHNRAPFDHIELELNKSDVSVLGSINGGGKTTIISHIVDAWHEMAKRGFHNEYEDKQHKLYRVSSALFSLDYSMPSLFYIRFGFDENDVDYIDLRNTCTKEQYEEIIANPETNISFDKINEEFVKQGYVKRCSIQDNKELCSIFDGNIATSFPAYRFEQPSYLTEPYSIELEFAKKGRFAGYLNNPIEVNSGLSQLANWVMDVILDTTLYKNDAASIERLRKINFVFEKLLHPKFMKPVRVGLGERHSSAARICVGECDADSNWISTIYPSIFNMSSGEHALICIFVEIIRQIDRIDIGIALKNATGVVLIDEVDKHLHIKLQKEVLPTLFNLFPNIQFIISSHSPFISMGLAEQAKTRTKIFDLDCDGMETEAHTNELYQEVYEMMTEENRRYKELYEKIVTTAKTCQLFVEDTYSQIYKIAWLKLNEIEFNEDNIEEKFSEFSPFDILDDNSCTGVAGLLNAHSVASHCDKKIIGLFDYDYDGSERFYNLRDGFDKKTILGSVETGFYKQKKVEKHPCMYALLLPVPERLTQLVASRGNWKADCKFANYVEVETLLPESYLSLHDNEYTKETFGDFGYYKAKDRKKANIWERLVSEPKETFVDFKILYEKIYELFGLDSPTSKSATSDEMSLRCR
ncbi:MAG: AAA family ATPase [Lachnospiraceae bacterium]|jgi:ABC-type cobalamin/Fe3+-siderophores transport system ATPase subunit|nr:AAA family ATPase [Lachnospiraceae bacterium]